MKVARTFFKAITIASTTLLLGLSGCAFDEPIDYTTGGSSSPSGGGTGGVCAEAFGRAFDCRPGDQGGWRWRSG